MNLEMHYLRFKFPVRKINVISNIVNISQFFRENINVQLQFNQIHYIDELTLSFSILNTKMFKNTELLI